MGHWCYALQIVSSNDPIVPFVKGASDSSILGGQESKPHSRQYMVSLLKGRGPPPLWGSTCPEGLCAHGSTLHIREHNIWSEYIVNIFQNIQKCVFLKWVSTNYIPLHELENWLRCSEPTTSKRRRKANKGSKWKSTTCIQITRMVVMTTMSCFSR